MIRWIVHQALHLLCILTVFAHTNGQGRVRPLGKYTRSCFVAVADTELYRVTVDVRLWNFGDAFELLDSISMGFAVSLRKTMYFVQDID
jgi:hypothetical protein